MSCRKIWNRILSDGETVEYEFSLSNVYRYFWGSLWSVLSLPLIFLFKPGQIFFLIVMLYNWFYHGFYLQASNAYAFTNRRVLIHKGWLSTITVSVDYNKITDVSVIEKFFEKLIFRSGELLIDTAGTSEEEIVLKHIHAPYEKKKKLDAINDRGKDKERK